MLLWKRCKMEELLALLKEKKWTIGSCESVTAGLFCASFAQIRGASEVLKGGIVSYQTIVKEQVVKVDKEILRVHGVISCACAKEMAQKARRLLDCDVCVSFTGNAGPDVMENKPAGYICCAIALQDHVVTYEFQLHGERNEIRHQVVNEMVIKLLQILKEK